MVAIEGLGVENAASEASKSHPHKFHKTKSLDQAPEIPPTESPAVQISLSEEAQELLSDPAEIAGPGKSQQSTAHRARAALELAEFAALRDLPFGKIVSTLAHNGDLSSLLPEPAADEVVDELNFAEDTEAAIIPTTSAEDIAAHQELSEAELALQLLQQSTNTEE